MIIIRLKAGIWKLRGIWSGVDRGIFPRIFGEQYAKHALLKCPETKKIGRKNLVEYKRGDSIQEGN
jgi:hypothetical protein